MTLTELQVELRKIEDHIDMLHHEIEKMKPKTEDEKKKDFSEITELAKMSPVKIESLYDADEGLKSQFVGSLAYIVLSEETDLYDRLLYLCRLSIGIGFETSAENIHILGLEFDKDKLSNAIRNLSSYKYLYLAEVFVLANVSGRVSETMLEVAADVARMMGCDNEEIYVLAAVAKAKLMQNWDTLLTLNLPVSLKNRWSDKCKDYIPDEWIIKQRQHCGELCTKKTVYRFKQSASVTDSLYEKLRQAFESVSTENATIDKCPTIVASHLQEGSVVKRGDTLISYKNEGDTKATDIIAPCNGMLFFVKDEKNSEVEGESDTYLNIYVVSYFDEYEKFCKWHKRKILTNVLRQVDGKA